MMSEISSLTDAQEYSVSGRMNAWLGARIGGRVKAEEPEKEVNDINLVTDRSVVKSEELNAPGGEAGGSQDEENNASVATSEMDSAERSIVTESEWLGLKAEQQQSIIHGKGKK